MSAGGEALTVTSALKKGTNIKVRSNEALTESVICRIISSEANSSDAYPSSARLRSLIKRPRYWFHMSADEYSTTTQQHRGF